MFRLVIIILLLLVGVAGFCFALYARKKLKKGDDDFTEYAPWIGFGISAGAIIAGLVIGTLNSFYTQDPGQASVLVSFTGEVVGINYEPGLHFKAIWDNRVEYDIRNNTLSYVGTEGNTDNYVGGNVNGPQITFQDADGVSGNIDLNIRYSVRGDAVGNIYNEYKTQQEFVNATLAPSVRAKTREVLSKYSTSQVYNERDLIKPELTAVLQENWDELGVDIEDIYLQEVRYPESITTAFANARSAKISVETAKANQEKARVEAETNLIKTEALTDAVLKEKLINALQNGKGTYVLGGLDLALGL